MNILKTIADSLINEMTNGFLFFINIKNDDSVNFIAKSSSFVNAGLIVKDASISSEGNGGGSPTFAQGGGKTTAQVEEINAQKTILEKYLPQMMSEDEIKAIINSLEDKSIPSVMKHFKKKNLFSHAL